MGSGKHAGLEEWKEQLKIDEESIKAFAKKYNAGKDFCVKEFDDIEEGKKLMRIASNTKGNMFPNPFFHLIL